jgi:hypothetical protein
MCDKDCSVGIITQSCAIKIVSVLHFQENIWMAGDYDALCLFESGAMPCHCKSYRLVVPLMFNPNELFKFRCIISLKTGQVI